MVLMPLLTIYSVPDLMYSYIFEGTPQYIPGNESIRGKLFFYIEEYRDVPIDNLTNYEIVVTNNFLLANEVDYLHSFNVKLAYYEWFPATYDEESIPNSSWIIGAVQGPYATAYFYDFGDEAFQNWFVQNISAKIDAHNYDGVFFDHFGPGDYYFGYAVTLYQIYNQSHPGYPLEQAMQDFLQKLRDELDSKVIISNQGYRYGADFLRFVDFDISESYFSTEGPEIEIYVNNSGLMNVTTTKVWPWRLYNWDSPRLYVEDLVVSALNELKTKYGKTITFLHLNYMGPYYLPTGENITIGGVEYPIYYYVDLMNPDVVAYCYAGAKIFNHESQPTYFINLGEPVSGIIDLEYGSISIRYFENGFIVINGKNTTASIEINREMVGSSILYEYATGEIIYLKRNKYFVTIPTTYDPITHELIPTARIFLYAYA